MRSCPTTVIGGHTITPLAPDWWRDRWLGYIRNGAALPTGRKRRRVCAKKKKGEEKVQDLDRQASEPPTSEL